MSIKEKLLIIQTKLKAPKGQLNSYGGYSYRSCEDILEMVKPLLKANHCILTISDEIVMVGDRYYIKATATITDIENHGLIDHEVVSVIEASKYIKLTEDEQRAIAWHNGLYGIFKDKIKGKETPLYMIIHFADMWASRVIEK